MFQRGFLTANVGYVLFFRYNHKWEQKCKYACEGGGARKSCEAKYSQYSCVVIYVTFKTKHKTMITTSIAENHLQLPHTVRFYWQSAIPSCVDLQNNKYTIPKSLAQRLLTFIVNSCLGLRYKRDGILRGYSGNLHTPTPPPRHKVLHKKFQLWAEVGGHSMGKLKTVFPKSSIITSSSGGGGILGKLKSKVLHE